MKVRPVAGRLGDRPDGRGEVVGRQVHLAVAVEVALHRDIGRRAEGLTVREPDGDIRGRGGLDVPQAVAALESRTNKAPSDWAGCGDAPGE